MSNFKPVFDGYFKLYLHDDVPERLADRADFTGQWVKSRRRRIMKRDRKFQVTLHIMDTDGHKRGLQSMVFRDKGGQATIELYEIVDNTVWDSLMDFIKGINK